MAKSKLDEIRKRISDIRSEKAKADVEIEQMNQEIRQLEILMEADAKNGDLESFRNHKKERTDLQDEATVLKAYMSNKAATVSEAEAKDAWREYQASYDKNFTAKLKELQGLQKDLASVFLYLVDLQNEGLKARKELAELSGLGADPGIFQIKTINNEAIGKAYAMTLKNPTAVYLIASGIHDDNMMSYYNSVLRLQEPAER